MPRGVSLVNDLSFSTRCDLYIMHTSKTIYSSKWTWGDSLQCLRWAFMFHGQRGMCIDTIAGLFPETWSITLKQRPVCFERVLPWCFAHLAKVHRSTSALRRILNTEMKHIANQERVLCTVIQASCVFHTNARLSLPLASRECQPFPFGFANCCGAKIALSKLSALTETLFHHSV